MATLGNDSILPESVSGMVRGANRLVQAIAAPLLVLVALRAGLAAPFWMSGVKKWDGFLQLSDVAVLLFTSEFKLHLPGGPFDYPAPALAAFLAGSAEIALPLLLVAGLATRFAAFGLLLMTIVIQLTIPTGWPIHLTWAAMALAIMAWGAGAISIDALLSRAQSK